jgi:HTH-type transcriptional regulator, competence development regulator
MDAFADRVRADRENAGLTVRQLAEQSQISFSYITKIETGHVGSGISPEIVSALAKALGCDELEYLYLSDVVPAPLKGLLIDARSRSFVRALLGTRLKPTGWDRLEAALAESGAEHFVSSRKSHRKSVA